MSNWSVCRLSSQYVNLLIIYLFQLRPARNSSKNSFFSTQSARGFSTVSAGMTANRASLLVFTLLVSSLLVSKHCPLQLFAGFPPSRQWKRHAIPQNFWHAKLSSWGFRTTQTKKIADPKHVTLQDFVSSPIFQNRVRLANLSATNESWQNQAEIV